MKVKVLIDDSTSKWQPKVSMEFHREHVHVPSILTSFFYALGFNFMLQALLRSPEHHSERLYDRFQTARIHQATLPEETSPTPFAHCVNRQRVCALRRRATILNLRNLLTSH